MAADNSRQQNVVENIVNHDEHRDRVNDREDNLPRNIIEDINNENNNEIVNLDNNNNVILENIIENIEENRINENVNNNNNRYENHAINANNENNMLNRNHRNMDEDDDDEYDEEDDDDGEDIHGNNISINRNNSENIDNMNDNNIDNQNDENNDPNNVTNNENDAQINASIDHNHENHNHEMDGNTVNSGQNIGNNNNSSNFTNNNINNNVISNSINGRKSKRRRRHFNLTKNKKWNKQFKRQKNHAQCTSKTDLENIVQSTRYGNTKLPKIIFNNKTLLHRAGISKFFLPDKRPRKDVIVPPTKFLLGGNISDPLNLNSLQDEALASMNAITPKSSPITTPPKVEVIIPPNICDPLHLLDPVDSVEYEKQLISPMKQRRISKHRNRKKKPKKITESDLLQSIPSINNISKDEATTETGTTLANNTISTDLMSTTSDQQDLGDSDSMTHTDDEEKASIEANETATHREILSRDLHLDLSSTCKPLLTNSISRKRKSSECTVTSNTNASIGNSNPSKNKLRRMDSMDKIVSPVIPQPGAWKRPPKLLPMGAPRNRNRTTSSSISEDVISPTEELCIKKSIEQIEDERIEIDVEQAKIPAIECSTEPLSDNVNNKYPCDRNICEPYKTINGLNRGSGAVVQKQNIKYQYGNYAGRYLGLQNLNNFSDVRLTVFLRHPYLFKDKDILDIGCNVGQMTFAVARKLYPKSIIGIDIDKHLIARARRNLALFVRIPPSLSDNADMTENTENADISATANNSNKFNKKRLKSQRQRDRGDCDQMDFFPVSFPICYRGIPDLNLISTTRPAITTEKKSSPAVQNSTSSAITTPTTTTTTTTITSNKDDNIQQKRLYEVTATNELNLCGSSKPTYKNLTKNLSQQNDMNQMIETDPNNLFPKNVFFRTLNYAVNDESQLNAESQQYDLIMCLSVTKWIHLNYGDAGLKMTFRRMFNQLRPGGKLILEAQNWASYKKRKKLTETIFSNYKNIEFFPNDFHEYLLSPEVGFSHSYALGVPRHASKGFYRPIQLYIKGDFTPSQVRWSDSYYPQTPYEPYRYGYYADAARIAHRKGSIWGHHNRKTGFAGINSNRDTPYLSLVNRFNTPSHGVSSSTSQYYNPHETDSYLPSYDNEVQTRHYCFASPLYSTVWSPPASGRKSASQTPLFGSIRRVNDNDDNYNANRRHIYLSSGTFEGNSGGLGSSRSVEDVNSSTSPQLNHVYAIDSSRSVREIDLDTNANSPKGHVYATSATTCCENSSSPRAGPSYSNLDPGNTESPSHQYSGESSRSNEQDDQNIPDE